MYIASLQYTIHSISSSAIIPGVQLSIYVYTTANCMKYVYSMSVRASEWSKNSIYAHTVHRLYIMHYYRARTMGSHIIVPVNYAAYIYTSIHTT